MMKLQRYSIRSRSSLDVLSIGTDFKDLVHSLPHNLFQNRVLFGWNCHYLSRKKQIALVYFLPTLKRMSVPQLHHFLLPHSRTRPLYSHCSLPAPNPNPYFSQYFCKFHP